MDGPQCPHLLVVLLTKISQRFGVRIPEQVLKLLVATPSLGKIIAICLSQGGDTRISHFSMNVAVFIAMTTIESRLFSHRSIPPTNTPSSPRTYRISNTCRSAPA